MKKEEARKLAKEGLTELHQSLQHGHSETLSRYLNMMSRFHRYSFNNILLIARQCPDAVYVAGFHTWRKLGRCVRKGEQGIGVFAPMAYRRKGDTERSAEEPEDCVALAGFRVVHVFDVSQTDGDDLPELATVQGNPGDQLPRLEQAIRESGIEIEYGNPGYEAHGVSTGGKIIIEPDLPPAQTFSILAHEFSHELMHQQSGRRKELSRAARETEAEAVAYIVCRASGLQPGNSSSDYIHLSRGDAKTLSQSLDIIQKTASSIIRLIAEPHIDQAPKTLAA
ncbi:MAG: ArdC-like ssDNA-binding domain-containing protein [Planctomycetota bacterium]|jgi:antirestriction protein ArdC